MKKIKEYVNIPNSITMIRIIGTIIMCFTQPLTAPFMIVYTIAGVSDALDGYAARKLKQVSEFGSRLDSISDLFFYITMMISLYPLLRKILPQWIWNIIWIIVGLRIALYTFVFAKFRKFASEHTVFNKLTGLLFFMIPYFVNQTWFIYYALLICTVALVAVINEAILHVRRPITV